MSATVTVEVSDVRQARKCGVSHSTFVQSTSAYCDSVFGRRGLSTSGDSTDVGRVRQIFVGNNGERLVQTVLPRLTFNGWCAATWTSVSCHHGRQYCSCGSSIATRPTCVNWSRHSGNADSSWTLKWNKLFAIFFSAAAFGILRERHPALGDSVGRMSECRRWLCLSELNIYFVIDPRRVSVEPPL
jgi:hypothetical protein